MSRKIMLLMVLGLLVGGLFLGHLRAQPREVKPLKIGVVKLSVVFEQCKKRAQLFQQLSNNQEKKNHEIAQKRSEIEGLGLKLNMLERGTPEWQKADEEMMKKQAELQTLSNFAKLQSERLIARDYQVIYADIRAAVTEFAKKNNYDLILKTDKPELTSSHADFLPVEMALRGVVYYDQALNVSQEVLDILNRKFELEAGR